MKKKSKRQRYKNKQDQNPFSGLQRALQKLANWNCLTLKESLDAEKVLSKKNEGRR